jgi:hypothetical protein
MEDILLLDAEQDCHLLPSIAFRDVACIIYEHVLAMFLTQLPGFKVLNVGRTVPPGGTRFQPLHDARANRRPSYENDKKPLLGGTLLDRRS